MNCEAPAYDINKEKYSKKNDYERMNKKIGEVRSKRSEFEIQSNITTAT